MKEYLQKMYRGSFKKFEKLLEKNLKQKKKMFIVTANPETLMITKSNKTMEQILSSKDCTIVPDGIGVIKACHSLDIPVYEKIPGVEIAKKLLEYGNRLNKTIFLLGAKEEVNKMLVEKIESEYPRLKIVGSYNGYIKDKEEKMQEILTLKPDIIMVALGIPNQELLINTVYNKAKKGIFIGVGGSFDVISGYKKRAPEWIQKANLEWLYRITREPKRLKRFYQSNIRFLKQIKIEKK